MLQLRQLYGLFVAKRKPSTALGKNWLCLALHPLQQVNFGFGLGLFGFVLALPEVP
jgi:hypothetical protein